MPVMSFNLALVKK